MKSFIEKYLNMKIENVPNPIRSFIHQNFSGDF